MLRRSEAHVKETKKALLHDLEALGRALATTRNKCTLDHLHRPRSISTGSRSPQTIIGIDRNAPPVPHRHRRRSSIWKWKPLKALTHVRRRRFRCHFTVRVHSVCGLPPAFEGRCLFVQWRRTGDDGRGVARTRAVRVVCGSAIFEEAAVHLCFVHANRGGRGSSARYEERQFVLYPSVVGAPEIDLGRHRFDITRLLPLDVEEMEKEGCSGEWTTAFRLSGKGKGATLSVSFGFSVLKEGIEELGREKDPIFPEPDTKRTQRGLVNASGNSSGKDAKTILQASDRCGGSRILTRHEVGFVFEASNDANGEPKSKQLPEIKHSALSKNVQVEEKIARAETSFACDSMVEELAAAFDGMSIGLDGKEDGYTEAKSSYKSGRIGKSKFLSLDDLTDSVSSDFLKMIGAERSSPEPSTDDEPDSPRERLWRQFERESLGFCFFESPKESPVRRKEEHQSQPTDANSRVAHLEAGSDSGERLDLSSLVQAAENEHQKATQVLKAKARAKLLEDAEAEALMQEWGMDEKAFAKSPPPSGGCNGFGSPIELPLQDPLALPPLGEGMGPFLRTKDGGYLRTMIPSLFNCSKNNGSLVMQVSRPVVVPAEMGADVMDILRCLASLGVERLSMQARKLMPLEDITGKTMQQVEWEALSSVQEADGRLGCCFQPGDSTNPGKAPGSDCGRDGKKSFGSLENGGETSGFVSLEELTPLATNKIEALSLEGLRIQTGLADELAPSHTGSKSCRGGGGSHDSMDEADGLMSLSITLDEWMRLDSGEVNEEDLNSERTSKILAAHHANSADLMTGGTWRSKKSGEGCSSKCGLLGNNFTVALVVQLRDPMRNYEPVGTPMLSLIQVERILVPAKMKVYCNFSDGWKREEGEEELEGVTNSELVVGGDLEKPRSQFTITDVHVAGLKMEHEKKRFWGNASQQTSGSRWLLANGMGKSSRKHPLAKAKAIGKSSSSTNTAKNGDILWSISSRVNGKGCRWKDLAALNPHIRNPNVIFPSQPIRVS